MWNVLLLSSADSVEALNRELKTEELILKNEYQCSIRGPSSIVGEHLTADLVQFGEIFSATSDDFNGG